jgi:diguanylate cyclase (GGDEF)-like protein
MKWLNKLPFRFWLAINSLVLTGILAFSTINLFQETRHMENALRSEGITAANTLNSAIGLYMLKGEYLEITSLAYSLLDEPNICFVRIKDKEGKTVIQKGKTAITKEEMIIEKLPLEYFKENVGEVEIGLKTEALKKKQNELYKDTIILTVIASLLSLFISYLISRRLTLPINKLIVAAEKMAAGQRQVEVEEDKIVEIQKLAVAFNNMTRTINNHEAILVNEINKATKELSEKISILEVLENISNSVLEEAIDRQNIFKKILATIKIHSKVNYISLAIFNKKESLEVFELDQNENVFPVELSDSTTSIHKVLIDRCTHICNNLITNELSYYEKHLLREGIQSLLIIPIIVKNKAIGTLNIGSHMPNFFSKKRVETLSTYTNQIALALDRIDAYESLQKSAYHDYLTGLPNYRLFKIRLNEAIEKAKKEANPLIAVIFLDLDRFKMINDTLGHTIGDLLLKKVGNLLLGCLSERDTVTRYGGDEFSILLPDIKSREEAISLVKKIIASMEKPIIMNEYEIPVSASIGIAFYPNDGLNAERLIQNADRAMYRVKEQGKKSYAVYSEGEDNRSVNFLVLENDLRKALEREEFVVYYQPKINIKTGTIAGLEALVRWISPHKGLVFPGDFIPFAEETGLIVQIGEFVMRKSCRQIVAWQSAGMPPLKVSVNLSTRQLLQSNLVPTVEKIICESGIQPELLELEITETMSMDIDRSLQLLNRLKKLGVSISVDDFGTGYSSLNYLRRLPIDRVKIDQSFIKEMSLNPSNKALVSTIINMAKNLGLSVTAEGVETAEQVEFLQRQHCDEIQGYFVSKPLSPEEFYAQYPSILKAAQKWGAATTPVSKG